MSQFIPTDYSDLKTRLKEGNSSSYWGGYYTQNVGFTPTQKKSFSGRILPSFNYELSTADQDYGISVGPYRNAANVDPETNQPNLSTFFAVVMSYTYFGNGQVSFLSPSTLKYTQGLRRCPETVDPIQDIRNFAKKHNDPAIRALTERSDDTKEGKTIIPYPQTRYVFNVYGTIGADRAYKNYMLDVSHKAFEDLATKLSEWRPPHETVIDPNWPDFLYGDITDPNTGLAVDTVAIPATPQPYNGFIFTTGSHKSLKGTKQIPVPQEALAGRFRMYGPGSIFKVMGAQEIIDFIVSDGAIPYHLVQQVCSPYANIPPEPKKNVTVSSPAEGDDEIPWAPPVPTVRAAGTSPSHAAPYGQPAAATPPPPPPAPALPPAPVQQPSDKFWFTDNGSSPELRTYAAVKLACTPTTQLMKEGDTVWCPPARYGFSCGIVQAATPPPPPPPPAPAPSVVVPPSMPTSAAPVIAASSASVTPPVAKLTPEEQQDMERIMSNFSSATPDDLLRYNNYLIKFSASK